MFTKKNLDKAIHFRLTEEELKFIEKKMKELKIKKKSDFMRFLLKGLK